MILAGRVVSAGLLGWMAWIHLHLWTGGYRHIHVIGPMFLVNFVAAVAVGLAVLGVPRRLLPVASASAALLAAGTLVGLAVSIHVGLFGFRDSLRAPFAELSVWVEAAAGVAGLALTLAGWRGSRWRPTGAGMTSGPVGAARGRG